MLRHGLPLARSNVHLDGAASPPEFPTDAISYEGSAALVLQQDSC
jgi:hypothetical protein